MSAPGIVFDQVWKKFHRGEFHDSLRDLIPATLKRMTGRAPHADELHDGDFWAIKDLSFEVGAGQTLGIIGPNGSGKSTTLKLLTRIYEATRGYCELRGRVGTLIEVSAGFHGDLTGRENIYLQGAIMGMRTRDVVRKFDEIVEFSGIADFIETPVKRYSSGMNARLGFAIAAHLEPEVLIIDEVLAVGDLSFQERAYGRIRDLSRSGIPVVMVSHQLERIAELCTDVIFLQKGEVFAAGKPGDVIGKYVSQYEKQRPMSTTDVLEFTATDQLFEGEVKSGARVAFRITGEIFRSMPDTIEPMVVRLRSLRSGYVIYESGSRRLGFALEKIGPFSVQLELQCNVPPGNYLVEIVSQDQLMQRDIAAAPSVMLHVNDAATFRGSVQLNGSLQASAQ